MTRNLNITLGNIDAVRAAAHTDPTSPTGAAVRDYAETTGTEQKNIAVDSITAQAQEAFTALCDHAGVEIQKKIIGIDGGRPQRALHQRPELGKFFRAVFGLSVAVDVAADLLVAPGGRGNIDNQVGSFFLH